jgi:hypothetical protein
VSEDKKRDAFERIADSLQEMNARGAAVEDIHKVYWELKFYEDGLDCTKDEHAMVTESISSLPRTGQFYLMNMFEKLNKNHDDEEYYDLIGIIYQIIYKS